MKIIKVFDNGLVENVNGEINGQLQITLKLDDDTPIYTLQRKEGKSTFSIGGRSVNIFQLQTIHNDAHTAPTITTRKVESINPYKFTINIMHYNYVYNNNYFIKSFMQK